jgi:hypothetical protein
VRVDEVRERLQTVARSEPLGTFLVYSALVLSAAASSVLLLLVESLTPTERATLILAGLSAWILLIALGWTRGTLPIRAVVVAIAITMGLAVATPSYQSKDVFSYAMYGRIVAEHHHSPYDTYPMHFEGDPMRRHVSAVWQRTPDIYGPAFTVIMAALAPLIGQSTFLARFLYQLIAIAAVGALLWLLWKRTRNPTVIAFVGLHPLVAVSVVNGGHPDALIALAFLIAFMLALERRVVLCGLALAFGVAINFSVVVGAVALGAWALRRWTKGEVITLGAITLGVGAVPYLFLAGWLQNAHEHQQLISRQSIWNPIAGWLTSSSVTMNTIRSVMPNSTTLVAGALLVAVLVRQTRLRTPELAIAAAITVLLVTSPWVMPWYAFAAFPFLAMRKPDLLSWSVAIYCALILVGDQFPSTSSNAIGTIAHQTFETVVPVAACIACVVAIVRYRRDREVSVAPVPAPVLA